MFVLRTYETIFNILENGVVEKKWVLLNESYLGSPPMKIYGAQVM